MSSDLLENFAASPGIEGPQNVITWDIPASPTFTEIKIVKKTWNFPEDETDGDVILHDPTGSLTSVVDTDVLPLQVYAYAGFTKVGAQWKSSRQTKAGAFTWDSETEQRRLFRQLPPSYQSEDGKKTNTVVLNSAVDPDHNEEVRAIHEDGSVKRGELERFLLIFGAITARIKGGTDFLPRLLDPNEVPPEFLAHLAGYLGWPLDTTKETSRQRAELRGAVPTYKRKGTISALEPLLRAATNIANVVVDEMALHMLVSNRLDRLSAQTVPAWQATTVYVIDDIIRPTDGNVNGRVFKATVGGTSGGSEPTWPTVFGDTVGDDTVTWEVSLDATIFDWYDDKTGFSLDFPEFDSEGAVTEEGVLYTFEMLRLWFVLASGEDLTSQEIDRVNAIMPLFAPGDTRFVIRTEQ